MNGKKAKILLTLITAHFALYADVRIPENSLEEKLDLHPQEDEVIVIERVIHLLEKQQKDQKKLKDLIVELRHNQDLFMQGEPTKIHAKLMLKAASESLQIIKKYHLEHLFSSEFLEELAILSSVGKEPK